jgi:diguanylate cyclase (GGDEF)-like protein/PAS domain S-box-containing protein
VTALVAGLAVVVAAMYGYIAFGVVPRLGRGEGAHGRPLAVARWGAVVFFAGCAMTHLGMAVEMTASLVTHAGGGVGHDGMPGMSGTLSAWVMTDQHLVSHAVQILGGAVFIMISRSRLELSVLAKRDAERLHTQAAHFRAAFEQAPLGIALLSVGADGDEHLLQVNPALVAMLGYERAEDLIRQDHRDRIAPADRHLAAEAVVALGTGTPVVDVELRVLHMDGHEITVAVRGRLVSEDGAASPFVVAQFRDVTLERQREARLRFLADHDALTGVLNRHRFEEELDRIVEDSRRHEEPAALVVVDLDQFKYVNDTYGHSVGDEVLVGVADALRARLRDTDLIGRLGGDEFGVLCPGTDAEDARALAQDLMHAVHDDARITVQGRPVRSAASVGVSMIRTGRNTTSDQLLAEADLAMYDAKQSGRERVSMMDAGGHALDELRSHLAGAERIREALAEDGFRLWEQPILNLSTGECDRSELLIRMIDPVDGSVIPPGRFLAAAERFGQIQCIDRWVFDQAVTLLAARQARGDHRALEVNLSGASLTDEALIDNLVALIENAPIDPSRLIVEITETAAVRSFDLARSVATRLSRLGCTFALDDFGAGFGSFYYLKHLPFQGIKIDGEFVKDLPTSRSDRLTVQAIVTLAQGLEKETTAEFVQDDRTVILLRELGVGYAQGYHIGRPQEVPELAARPGSLATR